MAKDIYHRNVKEALEKDGWTITDDPLTLLSQEEGGLQTDLGAEKIIVAERDVERIAVEVKSFLASSIIHEFHEAFGNTRYIWMCWKWARATASCTWQCPTRFTNC